MQISLKVQEVLDLTIGVCVMQLGRLIDHSPLSAKQACEAMSIRMFVENNSESKSSMILLS